jgi:hypothetical protein
LHERHDYKAIFSVRSCGHFRISLEMAGEEVERQPSPLLASKPPLPVCDRKIPGEQEQYTRFRMCDRDGLV